MNKIKHIILIILLLPVLYNCAAVAVGAVAAAAGTTAIVATDPRSSGAVVDDNTIETKLQYTYNNTYKGANIYVNSYNGAILLTGQVPNAKMRESATFEARSSPGVKQIYNYLDIRLPQSMGSKTTDSYTTTQVRTKILGLSGVSSNSIKVVTTNNVVYLAGVVTKDQATQVANAAAGVNGVEKVVTLFDYISR